jgi:predicted nucleic acid-binding protein
VAGEIVLVDTGPLVALLDPSDTARDACRRCLGELERADLVTTEAVVTEAMYLLSFSARAQAALQSLLATGKPRIEQIAPGDRERAAELIERYASLPMDYADCTLVLLAERLKVTRVFTLDVRDFSIYRVRRARFRIVPKPA